MFLKAKTLMKLKKYDSSIHLIEKCICLNSTNTDFLNLKTEILIAKSEYKDAFKSNIYSLKINDKCS